jgi:hypothetical protein
MRLGGWRLMTTFRRLIHGRVDPDGHRQLKQEAAARGVSMTACVGIACASNFALRTEMASAVTAPGKPGERHTGLIHSILARTEQRLVATLDARATELSHELRRLEIMLDRFVLAYLLHTPEVPRELQASAWTSANRRFANYRKFVDEQLGKAAADDEEDDDGQGRDEG